MVLGVSDFYVLLDFSLFLSILSIISMYWFSFGKLVGAFLLFSFNIYFLSWRELESNFQSQSRVVYSTEDVRGANHVFKGKPCLNRSKIME